MSDDTNYALHYARWHRPDAAYFQAWHETHGGHWAKLVGASQQTRILDIGCGSGLSVYSLRAAGYRDVIGVDSDARQIDVARSHGLPCTHVTPSPEDPFYADHRGQFDVILMCDVLEHIHKDIQIRFMRAVRRCLRPGGQVIVRVPNALGPAALFQRYVDHTHHCSFTIESLEYVLANAGFERTQIEPHDTFRLRDNWRNPWRVFRLSLVFATRALWKAAYIGELGREALRFPMTRDLLARAS